VANANLSREKEERGSRLQRAGVKRGRSRAEVEAREKERDQKRKSGMNGEGSRNLGES